MPNRIVREGIITSDRVNQLDWPAEVLYRRLLNVVDDFGRYDGRLTVIRAACYPLCLDRIREADLQRWITACVKAGLVRLYDSGGKPYIQIEDFRQQIRAKESKYPAPCEPAAQGSAQCDATRAPMKTSDAQQMRSTCVASAHLDGDVVGDEDGGGGGDESGSSQGRPEGPPHRDFVDYWNGLGEPFPKIQVWTDSRKRLLKARWRDAFWRKNWVTALQTMAAQDWCRGQGQRGWVANVEFFLRPDTVAKFVEGSYSSGGKLPCFDVTNDNFDPIAALGATKEAGSRA